MVFHTNHFYSTTLTIFNNPVAFLQHRVIDPYIRRFVRSFGHSDHRYFIDPRHIGDTIHLWTAFVVLGHGRFLPTSASSLKHQVSFAYPSRSLREGVSGRYSFHSTFQIISSEIYLISASFSSLQTCRGTSRTICRVEIRSDRRIPSAAILRLCGI